MEHALSFLLNAPASAAAESWVQVAKTGNFQDPRYGKFSITLADFAKWLKNFQSLSSPEAGREGLPVDIDHGPEKTGDTEAVGWIKQLEQRGNELWARVAWNSEGQTLLSDKRYAYISPSYSPNYKDETGTSHGTALVGIALTNRPFLQMATVNLSQAGFAAEVEPEPEPAYSHPTMELNHILTALSLSREDLGVAADADDATVLSALAAHKAKPAPVAVPEGHMVLSQEQVATLTAQAAAGAEAAKQLHAQTFTNAFTEAQKEGKVVLAQKDTFQAMYDAQPETTLKLLSELKPAINMEPHGIGGDPGDQSAAVTTLAGQYRDSVTPMEVDTAGLAILAKTDELMATRNIPFEQALELAQQGA